ncbi:hypothetical protein [Halomarina oriensis]|uniref:Uncharacterized protein n=1 Tax=Halomarina oriensis TaxID=671145 RepID=A0A6B0GN23_9EURY|nr:hypothetical protein [Halomarina oriensis]MWG32968.1 hypothetical protein [Halomarina oriensis]
MSEAHVTLYGSHAERFEEIREELEQQRGFEVGHADTVRELMAAWPGE